MVCDMPNQRVSFGAALAWWDSAEYRSLVALRRPPVADSRVFFIDGVNVAPT